MHNFERALKKYLDIFAGQEMYFINDTRNLELFEKYPSNNNVEDIRTKVSAINNMEIQQLSIMEDVVHHIQSLKMDDRLQKGDLTLVDDIANLTVREQKYNLLHFASVYCNFHKPELFPIYSEQHFNFYEQYIKYHNLALDSEKLITYSVFSAALNDLVSRFGLNGKMNYLQLRKFGWLYTDYVLKESAEQK